MDKALESAAALDTLRQQHAQQLSGMRRELQQQREQMKEEAAAAAEQELLY